MERARRGEFADPTDAIEDAVDVWHASGETCELHEWLGMTWEEYKRWVENPQTLPEILRGAP